MTLLRTSNAFMHLWPSQSIRHKKWRSTSCRLMVERLETRDLLSASTLMAVADGPFTIDKNTPIDIPILVNDTITDPISIVIVPNPLYGNAVVNPDNTVTYTPFVNAVSADLFDYAITNGSYTSVASVPLNIVRTASELYANYQTDVSLADQVYRNNVLTEAATRQTSIEGARIAAQSSALQAYADYDIAVSQANQGYSARVSLAETNYQSAVQTATATYQSSIDQAHTTYNAAADSGYTTYDATMAVIDQTHLDALAAADAAYGGAVAPLAPYQTALDSAQANYDANPENPEAQAALAQAQANFDAAFAPASNERAGAYASAYANKQTAQAAAEVAFITADDAAMAAHLSSRGAAEAAGASAEATAWNVYFTAKTDADNAYVSAELNAWIEYVSGVTNLNTNLASTEATAQSQFDTQMTSALTAWQNREDTAWTTYMTEKAKEPNAPPFGVRIFEPVGVVIPPVFAFGGFALQVRLQPVLLALAAAPAGPAAVPGDAFAKLPFNITNYRRKLEDTFDIKLQELMALGMLERDYWEAHHLGEIGSRDNGQILGRRLWAEAGVNIHDPSNMYLLPKQVHSTVSTLNSEFWAKQMAENGWTTQEEAYRNVQLKEYQAHQEKMRQLIQPYALGQGSKVEDLARVRKNLSRTGNASASVGSLAARAQWRQDKGERLARWGKYLGITSGVIAVLSGAATAGQIVNPSEATQLLLDDVLSYYEVVLQKRLNGNTIADLDLLNLASSLDNYLAAIQADNIFRAMTFKSILLGISR